MHSRRLALKAVLTGRRKVYNRDARRLKPRDLPRDLFDSHCTHYPLSPFGCVLNRTKDLAVRHAESPGTLNPRFDRVVQHYMFLRYYVVELPSRVPLGPPAPSLRQVPVGPSRS